MNRRTYLQAVVATGVGAGLSGCLDGESGLAGEEITTQTPVPFSPADDPWQELTENRDRNSISASGRGRLQRGEYASWQFQTGLNPSLSYSLTVDGEHSLDVFPMAGDAYGVYRERREARFYDNVVAVGASDTTRGGEIGRGAVYQLVFDNTDVFGSAAESAVPFEFEATATYET